MSMTATIAETYPLDIDFRWEDVEIGAVALSGPYAVDDDEIVSFAERYDPLPIHVDRAAAAASRFGGLIAAAGHVLAIRQRLMHHFGWRAGVIASIGYDDVRFLAPLRWAPHAKCGSNGSRRSRAASRTVAWRWSRRPCWPMTCRC